MLDIFKSSYYYYTHCRTLTIGDKEREEQELREKVIKIIEDNPSYGYRRIKPKLQRQGIIINHKKLLFFLGKWGLNLKRKIVKKTQSSIDKILSFLGSRVNAVKKLTKEELNTLGKVVFTDFTEIVYNGGKNKIWLIPYLEGKSKKIIGWETGKAPTTGMALKALSMAIKTLKSWDIDLTKTYFHQDQASIFKSYNYLDVILKKVKAAVSYSRVGKPQDNPEIESFFGRLKDEWKKTFYQAKTEEEILSLISYAISYYNSKRIHSTHFDKSPDEFLNSILSVKN